MYNLSFVEYAVTFTAINYSGSACGRSWPQSAGDAPDFVLKNLGI